MVYKDIAICKIKDFLLCSTLMEPMDYLECRKSLTRTGSHYHKYTLLPSCDSFYCAINCYALVISWVMAMCIIIERCFYYVKFN